MKKNIIIILVVVVSLSLVAFRLSSNKTKMDDKAKMSTITSNSIPVELTSVEFLGRSGQIEMSGSFIATSDLSIVSETSGKLTSVNVKKGSFVKEGQLLANVDRDMALSDMELAQAQVNKMKLDVARFINLSKTDAITKRQLEEAQFGLESAQAQLNNAKKRVEFTYIKAATSGVIQEDYCQKGTFVSPGFKLFDIVDVNTLKLNVKLNEREVLAVQLGQLVDVKASVYNGKIFKGKITSIAVKADQSMKYDVEIEIKNDPKSPLKAGMFGTASFDFSTNESSLMLERKAIIGSLKNPKVYVVKDGKAHLISIKIGQVFNDKVVVLDLKEGQEVILNGQINLKSGTKVSILK